MSKYDELRVIDQNRESVLATSVEFVIPGTGDHKMLKNRFAENQHLIRSIVGLQDELDIRPIGAPNGEDGNIPQWVSPTEIGTSIVTQKDNKIGIGKQDPSYTLDIEGFTRAIGFLVGMDSNGPYIVDDDALFIANPDKNIVVSSGKTTHVEGKNVAVTAWEDSLIFELTDRNTIDTFNISIRMFPDRFEFYHNDGRIGLLDNTGKLWLRDTTIGDLSVYERSNEKDE